MRKPTPKSTLLSQLQHHLQSLHISEGREMSSGAVSEEEVRAVLIHKSPITTRDLVNNFPGRIRSKKEREAFAAILRKMFYLENGILTQHQLVSSLVSKEEIRAVTMDKKNQDGGYEVICSKCDNRDLLGCMQYKIDLSLYTI